MYIVSMFVTDLSCSVQLETSEFVSSHHLLGANLPRQLTLPRQVGPRQVWSRSFPSMNLTIWSFSFVWTCLDSWFVLSLLEEKKCVGASVVRNKSHITKQRQLQSWGNGDCDTFAVSGRFWFCTEAWQDLGPQDSSNFASECIVGVSECQWHNILMTTVHFGNCICVFKAPKDFQQAKSSEAFDLC